MKSIIAALSVIGAATLAGCATGQPQAPAPTVTVTVTAAAPPGSAVPAATHAAIPAPTATVAAPAASTPVPVLGQLTGIFAQGEGFGQVRRPGHAAGSTIRPPRT